jgi:pimeloyl-ACP methyl ester carboxylesterase
VTLLAEVSFGVLPEGGDDTSLLADAWGITPRQATLGMLLAGGLDRSEAARAAGVSDAVAKKEIERLYLALGVGSAAGLAKLVAEANAMQWMMRATAGGIGVFDNAREPLRYALRDDGSRVAWSDYGPASGRPVLVAHCSMTTRFVSRRLVRALQARGFRPIAIDRPGFGLTDPLAGLLPGQHDPFAAAVADVLLVARQARVRRFDVVSRGAAHHLLALKLAAPDLVGRVVITNPDPASRSDPRRMGFLGAAKEAAMRRPGLIRTAAGVMANVLTESNFRRIFARSVEGSPPDEAAMAEPDIIEDYWRAVRPFLTGRLDGYVNEQTQLATMAPAAPQPGTHDWRFMVAEHDVLYDPAWVMAYWRRVLPDATAELLPGGGRLMAMAQADLIVDRLVRPG